MGIAPPLPQVLWEGEATKRTRRCLPARARRIVSELLVRRPESARLATGRRRCATGNSPQARRAPNQRVSVSTHAGSSAHPLEPDMNEGINQKEPPPGGPPPAMQLFDLHRSERFPSRRVVTKSRREC